MKKATGVAESDQIRDQTTKYKFTIQLQYSFSLELADCQILNDFLIF